MKRGINRWVSVILTMIFASSALVTGTYGWYSLNQTAKNETRDEVNYEVELVKLEKREEGKEEKPLEGVEFYLFTADGKQIGGKYVTNSEGKIPVTLGKGEYYFEEVNPGPGYTFDKENGQPKTRYPFTITGETKEVTVVKAYNIRLVGPLTVQKIVQNSDDTPLTEAQKAESFTFTVTFSDGGTYRYRIDGGEALELASGGQISLKHGQSVVFENIPVGVLYHVSEEVPEGYQVTTTGHQGNIVEAGSHAMFVNTYIPVKPGSLEVAKEVVGENADLQKEFTFTAVINGKEETFVLKHGESKVFPDLPAGTKYTVTETDYTADGYIASVKQYSGIIPEGGLVVLPFVNVYGETEGTGSLNVTKEVIGENPDPEKEFTFEITFEGEGAPPSPQTFKLKAGETKTFENIPAGVTYTVRETDSDGYLPQTDVFTGTVTAGEPIVITFKNQVVRPPEDGKLEVTKELAGEYPSGDSEKEFEFTMLLDGVETKFTLKPGEIKEFIVPEGTEYEVREKDYSQDGYTQTITNGKGIVTVGTTRVTVTNTYTGEVRTEITGEKSWVLNGYGDEVLPESIIVRLKNGGILVEEKVVTPDENGKWSYTFEAPKYDAQGNEIHYTIEEEAIESYIPAYEGYNITNTYLAPAIIDPPIVKKVTEGKFPPSTRFEFLLTGENGAPMPEGSRNGKKVISITGSGEAEFGEIKYTQAGVYTYTITELNGGLPGWTYDAAEYRLTVTVTEADGKLTAVKELVKTEIQTETAEFVNRYEKETPPDKTVIQGEKTWEHGTNPEEKRPTSIIVQIYADGELAIQRQVTEGENWQYMFELPRYGEDGHEIVYRVDEAEIEEYEKTVNGYDLKNTYAPDKGGDNGEDGTTGGNTAPGTQSPSTGDSSNPWLFSSVCAASFLCMLLLILAKKMKNTSKKPN